MQNTDVPESLRNARKEVIMALSAPNAETHDRHRRRADQFVRQAVADIQRQPQQQYDWSALRQPS